MQLLRKHIRLLKTSNLYLSFLTVGLLVSIVGPSVLDLQHLINIETQHISLIYIARYVGYIVGALLGGVILDLVQYRQAVLSLCCFVAGCTMVLVPWSGNIVSLVILMAVNGMFLGTLETGATVICLNLWGKGSAPVFQGLHFTFALGGLISPLIAAPFLEYIAEDNTLSESNVERLLNSGSDIANTTVGPSLLDPSYSMKNHSNQLLLASTNLTAGSTVPGITYPYSIVGSVSCLTGTLFLVLAVLSPTEDTEKEDVRRDNSDRSPGFMAAVVLLTFLLIFTYCGMEVGYAQMLTTYCVRGPLRLTVKEGSYLASAFWGAFAASRLASVLLALRFRSLTLIVSNLVLASASVLLVLCFRTSQLVLWVATVAFGAGIGPFYASAVGWVNSRVCITNKVSSVITVAASFGGMTTPSVISFFADDYPDLFAYVVGCTCLLCGLVVFATFAFFWKFDRRPPDDWQTKSGTVELRAKRKG